MNLDLLIDTSNRWQREMCLLDKDGKQVGEELGDYSVLELLDKLLKRNKVKLTDIKEIEAKMEGGSRVGILIGVSAANALNYCLGLKKVNQFEYPKDPDDGIL